MTDKLTSWFKGKVKPAVNGVYETDPRGYQTRCFQHWDGEFWGIACTSPRDAARVCHRNTRSIFQNDKWRGLASNPKDSK